MPVSHPSALSRLVVVLLLGCAGLVLAGCDPEIHVKPQIDLGDAEVAGRVEDLDGEIERLEAAVALQRARADRVEQELQRLQEENVVLATDQGFTFRLNIQAAVVLVVAILGLTTVLLARLRHGTRRP